MFIKTQESVNKEKYDQVCGGNEQEKMINIAFSSPCFNYTYKSK